jgi:hypothetical protein
MKLDFLSPEQWNALLSMHSGAARMLGRGFIRCGNCERREDLTPRTAEEYLRDGWPECCPGTLKGGTMDYYASEENLRKELARGD